MPAFPQYWIRDRKDGPRRACTGAMTTDGNCMHVILEGVEYRAFDQIPETVNKERKRPLGFMAPGLFVVEGNSKNELIQGLQALSSHIKDTSSQDDPFLLLKKKIRPWVETIEPLAQILVS